MTFSFKGGFEPHIHRIFKILPDVASYPDYQNSIIERLSLTLRKRQTAKMKLLPSVFSSLNSRVKIVVSVVNSRRHFTIFVI